MGLIAAVATTAYFSLRWIEGPREFWVEYAGIGEAEVVALLGMPSYDSRHTGNVTDARKYTLGWYHGWGSQLGMEFNEHGVVVRQWRGSK